MQLHFFFPLETFDKAHIPLKKPPEVGGKEGISNILH